MKIAMLDPSLFTGRYDDGLCAALGRAGHEVSLLGRPMRATDAIAPETYTYVPRFFRQSERLRGILGEGTAFRALKAAEYMASATGGNIANLRADDVIHAQWLPFPPADRRLIERLRARESRPALVHTVHNASAYHGDAGAQGRGYRALLDMFDALIVHGQTTYEAMIAQGIAPDRLRVVPHPPMELARAGEADLAAVPQPRSPRILFFGTIRPYKGFDLLIEACLQLWQAGLVFELGVAGKPFMDIMPLLGRIREAGFGDRLVLDLGFLTEQRLDAHLQRADIIAFPYRHIDSSGAFLSALHYGKAMVASRVGMFAALDESAVRLCAPEDVGELAGALGPLVADGGARAALGRGAQAVRAAMGDWGQAADATLAVYEQAIKTMRQE
ncbi:glycosyltransferase family 4 protein [Sphingobium sp. DEHP117]|uniref:glycosyltransferase family 4 protein n=1 Tax=Sphingobium sp. DEHP117 TaxID=2993436 RepID=UPI0027D546F3|nr:glycosyltransferase [Sphingobium sp. DEHP117]MDQ4420044.1 glycosyltransferase family 4 protein [Sphingobium sp. DEHP117]